MTADTIKIGKPYKIDSVQQSNFAQRLVEMGCIEGTEITKLFVAPGGDPIAFQIDTYVLSLRIEEAKTILVMFEKN
jgi:ferrous iron transport protein A